MARLFPQPSGDGRPVRTLRRLASFSPQAAEVRRIFEGFQSADFPFRYTVVGMPRPSAANIQVGIGT
jgi:hypothetical protein